MTNTEYCKLREDIMGFVRNKMSEACAKCEVKDRCNEMCVSITTSEVLKAVMKGKEEQ